MCFPHCLRAQPKYDSPMHTHFSQAYVLNVVAKDRPGIVAAISKAVVDFAGSIDTCSQTVLGEYFTLIMVVSFPKLLPEEQFVRAISDAADRTAPSRKASHTTQAGVHIHLRPYEPGEMVPESEPGDTFVITAFGPDQAGVVFRFSHYLAGKGINISDLYGTVADGQFLLLGQVRIPHKWDIRMLQADLENLAAEIGHTVRLHHENVFVATNQLRLPRSGLAR